MLFLEHRRRSLSTLDSIFFRGYCIKEYLDKRHPGCTTDGLSDGCDNDYEEYAETCKDHMNLKREGYEYTKNTTGCKIDCEMSVVNPPFEDFSHFITFSQVHIRADRDNP